MSDTPRTDDIWFDTSRKYSGALASSLYDLSRELERENAALRAEVNVTRKNYADYQTDNIALRAALDQQANYQRELRSDRDRLDWLSKHVTYFSPASEEEGWRVQFRTPVLRMNCKSNELTNVRQAIDAAMESKL
jgi:hypothetical protein